MDRVAIIILNYKKWLDTIECLKSIKNIDYKNYDLYIVDNNSMNQSLSKINEWLLDNWNTDSKKIDKNVIEHRCNDNKICLIQSSINNGYSAGNNIGIRYSLKGNCKFILVLNPDTVVTEDFLKPMVTFLKKMIMLEW